MDTLQNIRTIYNDGFKNLGSMIVKNYFKVFAWFGFAMYAVVLYAFVFRVATGFSFD